MLKRRLGKVCAVAAASAMFVSITGTNIAQAGGYGYGGYGHHGYSHGYKVGFGYSNYRGHYHRKHHHGSGRSYAAIIVPTIAIGVGALLYLDHKRRKHGHHHHQHTHHQHHGCGDAYQGCNSAPPQTPGAATSAPPPRNGSIDDRLAGGPSAYRQPTAAPAVPARKATDSPLVASNAPCKPVTSSQRGADGRMMHYQAMLCYHTNGTAFIQPGSMVPIGG